MRVLLLLRGAPGCGKSTWIAQNGLKDYALSADDIRLLTASPELQPNGRIGISQSNDKFVWDILFRLLQERMTNGEFTVIDATNSKTSEMKRYKEYCERYRYRCYVVDFTDVPIEEVKRRNMRRPEVKWVPEPVIDNMYARFGTQKIPAGITVIKPNELDKIWMRKTDHSAYERIHVIGDVHGCASCLREYLDFTGGLKENELYIFTGDYIDRGIENVETVKMLLGLYEKPNVYLLEGNHERWLWRWANGDTSESKEFELCTRTQLENSDIDPKDVRKFYRKLGQCAYFDYRGKTFLVTHGGLPFIPPNLTIVATKQMIRGAGGYRDAAQTDDTFELYSNPNMYQIHGHRNVNGQPIQVNERCFNLEGRVEFGGNLRCVTIEPDGSIKPYETKNTVFKEPEQYTVRSDGASEDVGQAVIDFRKNKFISEKSFGNISSFNFTKQAFYDKAWDAQTIRARGLYINVPEQKVVARGFSKFFNVNERPETKLEVLQSTLSFPVKAYVKENGFLGLVSYNDETDNFFITNKFNPEGEYADWLREMFYKKLREDQKEELKQYLKEQNVTLVFECVDMEHDPHIIEYPSSNLFLLDVIKNELAFKKLPYNDVCELAGRFGFAYKTLAYEIESWQEFVNWYDQVLEPDYKYTGVPIEGFVIEDSVGYMVKLKLSYYNFWKFMRGIAHETVKKGYIDPRRTSALTTPLANEFYGWIRSWRAEHEPDDIPKDICSLRSLFYLSKEENIHSGS